MVEAPSRREARASCLPMTAGWRGRLGAAGRSDYCTCRDESLGGLATFAGFQQRQCRVVLLLLCCTLEAKFCSRSRWRKAFVISEERWLNDRLPTKALANE